MCGGGQNSNLETAVYLSTAVQEMTPVALHGLLAKARSNNRTNNLTGALLYGDRSFIQVLEGPGDRIASMLSKIESDPRHSGMLLLFQSEIEERGFPDWAMGYRNAGDETASIFALTKSNICNRQNGFLGKEVLSLLTQFYRSVYPHSRT